MEVVGGEGPPVLGGGGGGDTRVLGRGIGGLPPEDRVALVDFVDSLHALLARALERPALFTGYNRELRAAWPQIEPLFDVIADAIRELPDDHQELAMHGLTGDELTLKLKVYNEARDAFVESLARFDRGFWGALKPVPYVTLEPSYPLIDWHPGFLSRVAGAHPMRVLKGALSPAFKIGDKILESVGEAISVANPVAAVAISAATEFKGAVETIVEHRRKR
jgi:hypothetical protein